MKQVIKNNSDHGIFKKQLIRAANKTIATFAEKYAGSTARECGLFELNSLISFLKKKLEKKKSNEIYQSLLDLLNEEIEKDRVCIISENGTIIQEKSTIKESEKIQKDSIYEDSKKDEKIRKIEKCIKKIEKEIDFNVEKISKLNSKHTFFKPHSSTNTINLPPSTVSYKQAQSRNTLLRSKVLNSNLDSTTSNKTTRIQKKN